MFAVNLVPYLVTPLVLVINLLIIQFGPSSYVPKNSIYLTQKGIESSLIEPRDQLMLLSWWLITLIIIYVIKFKYYFIEKKFNNRFIILILGSVFLTITIYSFLWDKDSTQTWRGVGLFGLAFGILFLLYLIYIINFSNKVLDLLFLLLISCFFIPALLQFPGSIRDYGHFKFTSDEISLFTAGHFPLYDYFPQYSNLLGLPIALLQNIKFFEPTTVAVFWILFLQIILFILVIKIIINFMGKKFLITAIFIAIAPSIAVSDTPPNVNGMWLLSPSTYFAVFPIRLIFPILTIFILFKIISKNGFNLNIYNIIVLGILSGITLLNNTDYGIPYILILSIYLLYVTKKQMRRQLLRFSSTYLSAILMVIILFYLASLIIHRPINLLNLFLFPRIFAFDGFAQYEIPNFGIHISIISLFITGTILGWSYLRRSLERKAKYYFVYGSILFNVSGWSLFCLVYFSGRSLIPTAIGGFAFLVSFTTLLLLPIFRNLIMYIKFYKNINSNVILSFVAMSILVVGVSATAIKIKSPNIYLNKISSKPLYENTPLVQQVAALNEIFDSLNTDKKLMKENLGFILDIGNLTEIETGIDSLSTTNGPNYNMNVSKTLIDIQCDKKFYKNKKLVVTDKEIYDYFRSRDSCSNVFNLLNAKAMFAQNKEYYLLEVRNAED